MLLQRFYFMAIVALAAMAGGCKSETTTSRNSHTLSPGPGQGAGNALSALDPCPERLHDLAGALLNFIIQYNRLPPTLEDLAPIRPGTPLALTCPLSNQKYIYNPNGIKFPPSRWAVVYDPAPSHSNMRWAIVFSEPKQQGMSPVPTVVAIVESEFQAASQLPIPNR